jgi:hypothetical protein
VGLPVNVDVERLVCGTATCFDTSSRTVDIWSAEAFEGSLALVLTVPLRVNPARYSTVGA